MRPRCNDVRVVAVGYTVDTLEYGWLNKSVDIDESLELSQFTLVDYTQYNCTQNYTGGASSPMLSVVIYLQMILLYSKISK